MSKPAAYYRALRTENLVTAGNSWRGDLNKGVVYTTVRDDTHPYVNADAAKYLVDQDLLVEVEKEAEDNPWFDSEDESVNGGVANKSVHGPISNVHRMDHTPE
jgi:hypothetical protein